MKQYPTKSYTWTQVAEHNKKDDCWVIHKQKVYDITNFLELHPGGFDMIFLGAGRDVTYLLQSYHLWSDKPEAVLRKYLIGDLQGNSEFANFKEDTGFYKELLARVKDYFETTGENPKNPVPGLIRLVGFFAIALISYLACFVWDLNWWVKVGFAVLYGIAQALPLLHCMHDASHTSIGSTPTMWSWLSHITMDLFAGASINSWMHQHVLSHHLYTNIHKADGDLPLKSTGDIRRIVPSQVWVFIYKFQWLYLPILYSLLSLKFRVQDVLDTLIRKTNGALNVGNVTTGKIIEQIITKTFFVYWRILFPIVHLNVPVKDLAILFLISELVTGWYLAFNFQVSHVSTHADFHELQTADEWAVLQVNTSVDYGHGSWMVALLSGALNYQTVHHLFPAISQYHYPALAPIVMDVCKKHGLKYNVLGGFTEAFKEHLVYLYELGNQLDKKAKLN